MHDRHTFFMKQALKLAVKGRGRTSPNPMVGAVVVRGDEVVGRGWHEFVGGPHAEVNALRDAGRRAAGSTLYVTLEPCHHHGRTPPCTEAILAGSVGRVVVGMADPNPRVRGGGAEFLRSRGIPVELGVCERECRLINQPFIKHATLGLPLVTLKAAATLDGRIATRTGDSRWITNERSRRFVHHLRCSSDAILVGIATALADDPQLTARLSRHPPCRQPVRIVLDTHLRLPLESRLAGSAAESPVWVVCGPNAPASREAALAESGVEVLRVPEDRGRIDLRSLLEECGRRQIASLLVEGGGSIHGSFIEAGLADEFHFFFAPKILGDAEGVPMVSGMARKFMAEALPVYGIKTRRFGEDLLLTGRFREDIY